MSLLKDDREQYVVGGIVSAISKAIGKKIPKSKLKKDLSQPTNKDFENVSREEILDYIETLPLNERLDLYGSNSPLKGKFEILDSDKIDFYEDVVNFNKLPDDYKSGDNSLLKAYLKKNDIPEKYMGDFDSAGEFRNVPFFKELESGKIQITIPPSTSMGKKKTKTFTNPTKKQIDDFFKQREKKNMGGLLENDETRMGYATGEKVVDPMQETINNLMGLGISKKEIDIIRNNTVDSDAVRKIIVRTEKDMGVEPGNLFEAVNMIAKKKEEREGMKDGGEFPDLNKDGEVTYADVLKGRGVFQEGGSIDNQMMMVMTPPMESEMEPDGEMEDNYTRFIMEEALTEEEEDMLMSKLEQDEELAMIFDKVIDVAQEFAGAGPVEGPGSGVSDSIPARLSDGEFVFTAKAVEEIGADNLMAMMKEAEAAADERQPAQEGGLFEEDDNKGSMLDMRKDIEKEQQPDYTNPLEQPPIFGSGLKR